MSLSLVSGHQNLKNGQKIYKNRCHPLMKKTKTAKNRNDHSIQAKSPIKIPDIANKKNQLTFRTKKNILCQQLENNEVIQQISCLDSQLHISKTSKLQTKNDILQIVSAQQYQLIDYLWQTTVKLGNHRNPLFDKFIPSIQNIIKKMMKLIASQKINQGIIALASSQKIKLRKCLCSSNCQNAVNELEFQDQYNIETSQNCQNSKIIRDQIKSSQNSLQINDQQEQQFKFERQQNQIKKQFSLSDKGITKNSPKQQTQQLELRKILYMLEGKKKSSDNISVKRIPFSNNSPYNHASNRVYYQSLSSFNPNPSEDSGMTLLQIQRYEDQYIKDHQETQQQYQQRSEITLSSAKLSTETGIGNFSGSSCKRKVLEDIIGMLNRKYNKNIKLN